MVNYISLSLFHDAFARIAKISEFPTHRNNHINLQEILFRQKDITILGGLSRISTIHHPIALESDT